MCVCVCVHVVDSQEVDLKSMCPSSLSVILSISGDLIPFLPILTLLLSNVDLVMVTIRIHVHASVRIMTTI